MNILKSALPAAILFASMPALAFDDDRQGLIMGLGAGFQTLRTDAFNLYGNTGSMPAQGLATSFKIGAGVTNQIALYYVRNDSWFRAYPSSVSAKETTYTTGISGIGATYFLAPTAPSGYFLAATGTGYVSAPFKSGNNPKTGRAFMVGGGYEFEKSLAVEWTLLTTHTQSSLAPSATQKSTSLQFTINYLLY